MTEPTEPAPPLRSPDAYRKKLAADRELAEAIAADRAHHTWQTISKGLGGISDRYPDRVPLGTLESWLRTAGLREAPPSIKVRQHTAG